MRQDHDVRFLRLVVVLFAFAAMFLILLCGWGIGLSQGWDEGKELGIREGVQASIEGRAYIYHAMNSDDQDDILVWID